MAYLNGRPSDAKYYAEAHIKCKFDLVSGLHHNEERQKG